MRTSGSDHPSRRLGGLGAALPALVFTALASAAEPPRSAESLAATVCAACHGPTLTGGSGPNLLDATWNHGSDDAAVLRSIRDGWPAAGMPAFREVLTTDEQQALVAFLRRQGAEYAAGRIAPPPPPPDEPIESDLHTFKLEPFATGLDTPWGLAALPDGRWLVTERPGRLRVISATGHVGPAITGLPPIFVKQDGGLLDVVLHPDYARHGWIYLAYCETGTVPGTSMTVIARGRLRADAEWIDHEVLFRAPPATYVTDTSHYGSRLLFDRTGHLLFTLGDRGAPDTAQDLGSPLGKIHRIREDGGLPADNPLAAKPGAWPTLWSYGHRHPQGLAFDPRTGHLWSTEHGPIGGDELNRIVPAGNFGWPIVSRGIDAVRRFASTQTDMLPPAVAWSPSIAPAGMAFYTGEKFPRWRHHLFVAGLIGQQLRRLEIDGDRVVRQEILFKGHGRVRSVVNGPDGLLYVALNGTPGRIVRLVPVGEPPARSTPVGQPSVSPGIFGRAPDGRLVESFTLRDGRGAVARIATYGAMLTELRVPDRDGLSSGVVPEIVASERGFTQGFLNAGAVIGRVADRIRDARFRLDGREHRLTANAPPHHLHGGRRGFDRALWQAHLPASPASASVTLTYTSLAGEEGYPGNLTVSATYTLAAGPTLRLDVSATADAPTPLGLSHQPAFNLAGGGDILDHELTLAPAEVVALGSDLLPTGEFLPVAGTPLDFLRAQRLGGRVAALAPRTAYENTFRLDRPAGDRTLRFAARMTEAQTGRTLEVWTTEPALHLQTSRLSEQPVIARVGSFRLEPRQLPDAVNRPEFSPAILRPGETWRSTTEYRFSLLPPAP